MKRLVYRLVFLFSLCGMLILAACSEDDPVSPSGSPDYFPFHRGSVWTYTTNVFKGSYGPGVTMLIKIDTSVSSDAVFDFLQGNLPDHNTGWRRIIALLDSAGVIYSLGDHPRETLYPLFKHQYASDECTPETITVQGRNWETVRYELKIDDERSVTWWFADGVGLVREHSMQGISLFSDDNDDEVLTELVSYTR